MPAVPTLETPTVQAEALPGRANPRIDDNVSAASFGAPLAQGLEAVGAAGSEEEAKLKTQNDQLRVVDANTQLEAAKTSMLYGDGQGKGGAFSLHGMDAMDMPNKILPQYDQVAAGIASSLTPDQQRLFHSHVQLGRNELDTSLNRYEYEESNRLANAVYTNGAQQTITNATVGWRDPQQLAKARLDLQGLVTMQGDREGWNADERAAQLAKLQAEMHFNVVDRQLADGKPQAALAYFRGIRDTGELTGEQSHQLGAQIDAALQQHTAQNQTEIAARLRDVSAAAMNGLAISPGNMPSRAAVLAAFPQDGERRYQAMQGDIALGAQLKGMSGMSTQDLGAMVQAARPTQVEGAADQLERYSTIARAAQTIVQQRAADPRQYITDNKLGSNPLDFSDMGALTRELSTRLASTQQDSERLGGYVPPLSKQEAQQFAQRLSSMPAPQRATTLAALSTNLADDKGYQTLMRQVMPGSPVTAIVGSQLNQAKPNRTPVWMDPHFVPDPAALAVTLKGEALLNPVGDEKAGVKGKAVNMPPDGTAQTPGMRQAFNNAAGDLFRNRPELGEAVYATFRANYAGQMAEKGDSSGILNSKMRDAALKAALGGMPIKFNGQSVVAPIGMDPSRFESAVTQSVNAIVAKAGKDPKAIQGYQIEEIGGLGSGRYKLLNGNAELVKPDGSGAFEIDLRNQYLPDRATPMPADVRNQATAAPPPPVADSVGGRSAPAKPDPALKVVKAPPVTGLGRGRGSGRTHPSQADPEAE